MCPWIVPATSRHQRSPIMTMTASDAQDIDLTPALNAFSDHVPMLLESAEKLCARRTVFSANEDFLWQDGDLSSILTVYVTAFATPKMDCYELQLGFSGKEATTFVSVYRERLIGSVTNMLKVTGWVLPEDGVSERTTEPGFIFFSLRRGPKPE